MLLPTPPPSPIRSPLRTPQQHTPLAPLPPVASTPSTKTTSPAGLRVAAGRHALIGAPNARFQALLHAACDTMMSGGKQSSDVSEVRPASFYESLLTTQTSVSLCYVLFQFWPWFSFSLFLTCAFRSRRRLLRVFVPVCCTKYISGCMQILQKEK